MPTQERSVRESRLWLSIAGIMITCTPMTALAQGAGDHEGTYVVIQAAQERVEMHEGIEAVVSKMGAVTGAVARRSLVEVCQVPERIVVRETTDGVAISLSPWPERMTDLSGTPVRFRSQGKSVTLRRMVRGTSIVEVLATGSSRRVLVYSLSSSGDVLTVRFRFENSLFLPEPVVYTVNYRRQG